MFPTKKINDDKYESCDDPEVSTSNTSNNTRDKDNDDNSASILGRILLDDDDGCNSQWATAHVCSFPETFLLKKQ